MNSLFLSWSFEYCVQLLQHYQQIYFHIRKLHEYHMNAYQCKIQIHKKIEHLRKSSLLNYVCGNGQYSYKPGIKTKA